MIEPTEIDIGRRVKFTGYQHFGGAPEYGHVTSFNPSFVFVHYDGLRNPQGIATLRSDLEWEDGRT